MKKRILFLLAAIILTLCISSCNKTEGDKGGSSGDNQATTEQESNSDNKQNTNEQGNNSDNNQSKNEQGNNEQSDNDQVDNANGSQNASNQATNEFVQKSKDMSPSEFVEYLKENKDNVAFAEDIPVIIVTFVQGKKDFSSSAVYEKAGLGKIDFPDPSDTTQGVVTTSFQGKDKVLEALEIIAADKNIEKIDISLIYSIE